MTEKELREKAVAIARSYLGAKQGSAKHAIIIDTFNKIKPDGWAMTYTAPWCATFVTADAILAFGVDNAKKYFPLSANCPNIITRAKKMGIFVEKDSYVPKIGDWLLYDWDDKTGSKGDNTGSPDHVGIVEKVTKTSITIIEGNFSTLKKVGERTIAINGWYIRGFVTPKYSAMATKKKTVEQIAKEVIDGKWGTGDERKRKLTDAGYDYNAVQKKVNELMPKKKPTPIRKKILNLARKQLGNGYKKYCKAYGKDTSWCMIFFWWLCMKEKVKCPKTTWAKVFAAYCKKHYKHIKVSEAQYGDVIFYVRKHNGHNRCKGLVVHMGIVRAKAYKAKEGKNKGKWVIPAIEGNVGKPGQWKTNKVGNRTRCVDRVWGIFRIPYEKLKK